MAVYLTDRYRCLAVLVSSYRRTASLLTTAPSSDTPSNHQSA
jgi:hypothetical protein